MWSSYSGFDALCFPIRGGLHVAAQRSLGAVGSVIDHYFTPLRGSYSAPLGGATSLVLELHSATPSRLAQPVSPCSIMSAVSEDLTEWTWTDSFLVERDSQGARRLGALLRGHRKAQEMSRADLAHLTGLTEAYIGMLERGDRAPTIETTRTLFNQVGCPINSGLDEDDIAYVVVRDPESQDPIQARFKLSGAALEREQALFRAKVKKHNALQGRGASLLPLGLPDDLVQQVGENQWRVTYAKSTHTGLEDQALDTQHSELLGNLLKRACRMSAFEIGLLIRAARLIESDVGEAQEMLKRAW
jgi:transcriptional regulator with XRE-family HTH domain